MARIRIVTGGLAHDDDLPPRPPVEPDEKVIVDLLEHVGSLFTSSLELKETIDFMLQAASNLVDLDAATVFLLDDQRYLSAIATFPFAEAVGKVARFAVGEGIVGWAAEKRKVVAIDDATKDKRFKNLELNYSPRSFLVVPLESPRRLVGALTVARKDVRPFSSLEQALMQIIANQAAISIDNARLYAQQKEQLAKNETQKRELEIANAQVKEMSRLKSEFLANMSHELRTPLNAILGFSEILKDNLAGDLTPEQKQECLENIHASGKHLLELVNDVLDLSKIEAGRMELQYEDFFVKNAFKEVLNVVRSLSERHQLDLSDEVIPDELELRADKSKFKQIMYNLLSNAIKFTPAGGRAWVRASEKKGMLTVEVGDTGIGIAPEYQDRIFNEFYQIEHRDSSTEGTGLGLSLTRRLIHLHGGTIAVESEVGEGTVFTFTIPVEGLDAPRGRARNRIFLIEDNVSNRELVKMVLAGNGYQVESANDAADGLKRIRSEHFDLVLMDIQLPGMDGLSATRMLKADPKTASIPVVALTAYAMKGDEQDALAAGCAGYITKPIEVATFVEEITKYLEKT